MMYEGIQPPEYSDKELFQKLQKRINDDVKKIHCRFDEKIREAETVRTRKFDEAGAEHDQTVSIVNGARELAIKDYNKRAKETIDGLAETDNASWWSFLAQWTTNE